jgi:adenine-specific DNA-methyltransferase
MLINQVLQGDCLELMRSLPNNSIDLICTDPPYFKCKQGASGIDSWWDNQWDKPTEFLKWIDKLAEQWQRILKPNGSLYCFASYRMTSKVEVTLEKKFNVVSRITWQKPPFSTKAEMFRKSDLRSFFPASESIIFCEHYGADNAAKGEAGYEQKCNELRGFVFEPIRAYLDQERIRAGIHPNKINLVCGYREKGGSAGRHWFSSSQWELPIQEKYEKLQESFPGYFLRSYESLRLEYESLRLEYESLRRPFNVTAEVPYTDVWTFPTVQSYPGKHLCEKPAELLEHIITASSRLDAVVLDCFAGSGSTLLAAKKLGREYIGMEIDPHWVSRCNQRLGDFTAPQVTLEQRVAWLETQVRSQSKRLKKVETDQLSLFDIAV